MDVPYYQCRSCHHTHTEGGGCPYCGAINLIRVIPYLLISLAFLFLALFGGLLPQILPRYFSASSPGMLVLLRVIVGIGGLLLFVLDVGYPVFNALRPRTQRSRAVLEAAEYKDLESIVQWMADPDAWVRYVAQIQADQYSPEEYHKLPPSLRARATFLLIKDLHNEPDGWDTSMRINTLGRLADPQAIDPLLEILRDPESDQKHDAAWALGHIGSQVSDTLEREKIGSSLIAALESGDANVWQHAWALGRIKDPRALSVLPAIIRRTARDEDTTVPFYAAMGLGLVGAPAIPVAGDLVTDADKNVRTVGVWTLGQLLTLTDPQQLKEVQSLLNSALSDKDDEVRRAAKNAHAISP